eukprot:gene8698-17971_t
MIPRIIVFYAIMTEAEWWDAAKSSVRFDLTREWKESSKTAIIFDITCSSNKKQNDLDATTVIDEEMVFVLLNSGTSRCMSGNPHRLASSDSVSNVTLLGFNQSMSKPDRIGLKKDGKQEYFNSSMPSNLTLLRALAYAEDGGMILRLNPSELSVLKNFLKKYSTEKDLKVNNRTYEVDNYIDDVNPNSSDAALHVIDAGDGCHNDCDIETAFSNTAVRYFNTKVNVSNITERVLTLLMTGLSLRDWYCHVKHGSLVGLSPNVDMRRPMGEKEPVSEVGQRYEIDCMKSDYNAEPTKKIGSPDDSNTAIKSVKLKTRGGARAAVGKLLKTLVNPEGYVYELIQRVEQDRYRVQVLAADSEVITTSTFQVMSIKVELLDLKNIFLPRWLSHIIMLVELAVSNNINPEKSNFSVTEFKDLDIYKLWGEFFVWAVTTLNLKSCPLEPSKTRYEVYKRRRPNMKSIR